MPISSLFMLISLLAAHPVAAEKTDLFVSGQGKYNTYRIPSLVVTAKGSVLAFCEGRRASAADSGDIDLIYRRSVDHGETWSEIKLILDDGPNAVVNPCPVVDRTTGALWLTFTRNLGADKESAILMGKGKASCSVWVCKSVDDGMNFSEPVEITSSVKLPDWGWYATGPGIGIQTRTGRLVIPCNHNVVGNRTYFSHVFYSDDHGASWKLGGSVGKDTNECQVAELANGDLIMNMRSYAGRNRRAVALSRDQGATWLPVSFDEALIEPVCQASLISFAGGILAFSNPASTKREQLTVKLSPDGGKSWHVLEVLQEGYAAYSCLAMLGNGRLACLYEWGGRSAYEKITLARFPAIAPAK